MKKTKLFLLMLLAVIGWGRAAAETVSPYVVDFNKAISTANHDFAVSSNWMHIVGIYHDSYADGYMSYSYYSSEGIDGSGTLLAYRQYAQNMYNDGDVCYDLLVTPKVTGTVTMYVKPSSSATSSYPAMVEIYDVDEAGATCGSLIQKFTVNNGFVADDTNEGWSTITLNIDTEKRIGIRAQYVYMDNFSATSAELVKEAKLTISNVTSPTGSTPVYYNQKEDGTVDINVKVKLKNEGEVDFVAGETENYTLSLVKGAYWGSTNTVYDDVKFNIPMDLAVGDEAEVEAVFNAPADIGTGWFYVKVKENITGSISSAKVQAQVKVYESKFVFDKAGTSYSNDPSATTTQIVFGKIVETTTLNYEIYNAGSAPLVINSFTLPEGFTSNAPEGEFTVMGGEKKQIAITLPADNFGSFVGELVIEYTNYGKEKATYTLGISGSILDPSKNLITFDDGAGNAYYPQGSVRYSVYISSEGSGDAKNYYLRDNSSGNNRLYITPLMTAAEGESIAFDAEYSSYSNNKVEVMISTDRQNWTTIKTVNNIPSDSYWTTYTATIPEAGDYYIGFKLTNALIDNIYGLVYATAPEHDLLIVKSNIPSTGKQNEDYTATVSIGNVGPNVETAGSYTATLYVDGEAVATSNGVDLPVAVISGNYNNGEEYNYTVLSFTFRSHFIGEKPAYIEVKSGDAVVATEVVNVNFKEEKVESDVAVSGKSTSNTSLLHLNWNNSESVSLYTPQMLEAAGLKEGDVIESITYKGYCNNSSDYSTQLSVWYEATEETEQALPSRGKYSTDGMTQILSETHTWTAVGSSNEWVDLITINLSEPIVYDGNALRFLVLSEGTTYKNGTCFEVTNTGGTLLSCYHRNDRATEFETSDYWNNNTYVPAIHFGLKAESKTLTGIVTEEDGTTPVAGATVTIRNDENDIEYFATTDEAGAYSINVVQNNLTYTTTVTANGYETLEDTEELNFTEQSHTKNFVLTKMPSVDIAISQYGYSTFYYSNSAYIIPEGVTAYIVSGVEGKSISLVPLDGVIPAGCGVLLEGAEGSYTFEATSDEVPGVDNMLRGTDETETIVADPEQECKYYMLSVKNGVAGFYFGVDGGGVFENKAHKAYLAVPVKLSNGVNFYGFDNATGINYVRTYSQKADGAIYNLSGQRVNNSYKGVVIVNGKKVLKK